MEGNRDFRLFIILTTLILALTILCGCINNSDIQGSNTTIFITDANGELHTIHPPVKRIVTQNSDLIEMLTILGAGDTIVGASENILDFPDMVSHIPHAESIGNWQTPNIEKILSLHPDLMITYGGRTKNVNQILAANISAVALDLYHVPTLPREARILGQITGKEERAEEYASFVENYLALIESRLNSHNKTAMLKIYMEHYGEYASEGKESAGTELLALLHTSHIGADLPGLTQKVSPEWIIEQKPDVIIKIVNNKSLSWDDLNQTRKDIMNRIGFDFIPAVKSGRVYVINADLLNSPRGIIGAFYVAKALYPGLFDDVNPEQILTEYADRFNSGVENIPARCIPVP